MLNSLLEGRSPSSGSERGGGDHSRTMWALVVRTFIRVVVALSGTEGEEREGEKEGGKERGDGTMAVSHLLNLTRALPSYYSATYMYLPLPILTHSPYAQYFPIYHICRCTGCSRSTISLQVKRGVQLIYSQTKHYAGSQFHHVDKCNGEACTYV